MAGLVMGCSLMVFLTACSENNKQSEGTTAAPKSQQSTVQELPLSGQDRVDGACATLLTEKCTVCHSTARTCEKLGRMSKSRWQRTIDRMITRGAKLNADESAALLVCLDNGVSNDLQAVCR